MTAEEAPAAPPPDKPLPAANPPIIEDRGKPIAFKPDQIDQFSKTVDDTGTKPTTYRDCMRAGGHAWNAETEQSDRFYFAGPVFNPRTGKMEPGPRVCEICGTVGI